MYIFGEKSKNIHFWVMVLAISTLVGIMSALNYTYTVVIFILISIVVFKTISFKWETEFPFLIFLASIIAFIDFPYSFVIRYLVFGIVCIGFILYKPYIIKQYLITQGHFQIIIFILLSFNIFTSVNILNSLQYLLLWVLITFICFILGYLLVFHASDFKKSLRKIWYILLTIHIINLMLYCFGINIVDRGLSFQSMKGIFYNANTTAIFLLITLIITFFVVQKKRLRLRFLIVLFLMFSIFLTTSRSVLIASILSILIFKIYKNSWSKRIIYLIIALSSAYFIYHLGVNENLIRTNDSGRLELLHSSSSILEKNIFFGIGYGNTDKVSSVNGLGFHNSFITAIYELGWLTTIILVLMILLSFLKSFKIIKINNTVFIFFILALALLLNGMFESTIFYPTSVSFTYFWMYIYAVNIISKKGVYHAKSSSHH